MPDGGVILHLHVTGFSGSKGFTQYLGGGFGKLSSLKCTCLLLHEVHGVLESQTQWGCSIGLKVHAPTDTGCWLDGRNDIRGTPGKQWTPEPQPTTRRSKKKYITSDVWCVISCWVLDMLYTTNRSRIKNKNYITVLSLSHNIAFYIVQSIRNLTAGNYKGESGPHIKKKHILRE